MANTWDFFSFKWRFFQWQDCEWSESWREKLVDEVKCKGLFGLQNIVLSIKILKKDWGEFHNFFQDYPLSNLSHISRNITFEFSRKLKVWIFHEFCTEKKEKTNFVPKKGKDEFCTKKRKRRILTYFEKYQNLQL